MGGLELVRINLKEVMNQNPKNRPDAEALEIVNQAMIMLRDEIIRNPNRDEFRVSIDVLKGDAKAKELRDKIWILCGFEETGMFLHVESSVDSGNIYHHPRLEFYVKRDS